MYQNEQIFYIKLHHVCVLLLIIQLKCTAIESFRNCFETAELEKRHCHLSGKKRVKRHFRIPLFIAGISVNAANLKGPKMFEKNFGEKERKKGFTSVHKYDRRK